MESSKSDASAPDAEAHEEGRPPIFPSWNSLYLTVVVYSAILILIFYGLSVTLDYSGGL